MTLLGHRLSRRGVLAGASLASGAGDSRAQGAEPFTILSHRVHQQSATNTARAGGDVTAAWQQRNNRRISWLTFDVAPIHDRLLRELSLSETTIDLAYAVNTAISPRLLRQLEPLDAFQSSAPIERFDEISPGLVSAVTLDGVPRAVPIRHATVGLFWNEALFEERGVAGPPTTMEQMLDAARRLTWNRNGVAVSGLALQGTSHFNLMTMAFGFGAPLLDANMQLLPNEAGMRATLETFRDLFANRVLPRNFPAMGQEDVFNLVQTGRAAMALAIMGRYLDFNDPAKSQFAGRIKLTPAVALAALQPTVPLVATSDFWSMAIPRNARNKPLAWSLMRELSSPEATVRQALNGNGPVRPSAYDDSRVQELIPYAETEARVLRHARPPLPLFENSARVADFFRQITQSVTIGQITPAAAVEDLKRQIPPMLAG